MWRIDLGPKYKHINENDIEYVLSQIIHEEVKFERISSETVNKLFVDRIKNLISYVKKSKYFFDENKKIYKNITNDELIKRCMVLTKRATTGILPLLEISCKKRIIDKKNFFKQKKNLENTSYQKKFLDQHIVDFDREYDENQKREFLHLDDNEYSDYLMGKTLYYIIRALKSIIDSEKPEMIFEMSDMASEAYFSFLEQYNGIMNASKSADKKNEKETEVKAIFNGLLRELGDSTISTQKRLWDYEKNRLKTNYEIVNIIRNIYKENYHKELERSNKWIEGLINRTEMNNILKKIRI